MRQDKKEWGSDSLVIIWNHIIYINSNIDVEEISIFSIAARPSALKNNHNKSTLEATDRRALETFIFSCRVIDRIEIKKCNSSL